MRHFTFPLFFSLFLYVCVLLCVCDFPLCKEIIPNNQEKHKRHPGIPTHPHWPQSTAKCITNSIIKYVLGTLGFQLQPSNAKKKGKQFSFEYVCLCVCWVKRIFLQAETFGNGRGKIQEHHQITSEGNFKYRAAVYLAWCIFTHIVFIY